MSAEYPNRTRHKHPTRDDLVITVHENGPWKSDIWAAVSMSHSVAAAERGPVWAGCTVYVRGPHDSPEEAFEAAVRATPVLEAMIAAAREALS